MATILETRAREYYITDDRAHRALIPRDVRHPLLAQLLDFRTRRISPSLNYEALPYAIKIGGSVVGIYSAGPAHAQSEHQVMFRTDDGGLTYQTTIFYDTVTGLYDLSLLNGLLALNDVINLKSWYVQQTPLGPFVSTNGTVENGGLTYALWSRTKPGPGGVLWRTGYAVNGPRLQAALFQSVDKGITWTFKIMLFQSGSLSFGETDFINTTGTTWKFICREETGTGNPLYQAISTDNGATIGAPTLISGIQGRQPCLMETANGNVFLGVGDRVGGSGFTTGGDYGVADDLTGIGIYRSTDRTATWGPELLIDRMYSTDGGQPMLNELSANQLHVTYYSRRSLDTQPVVSSASFIGTVL